MTSEPSSDTALHGFLAHLAKLLDLPPDTARHILEVVEIRTRL